MTIHQVPRAMVLTTAAIIVACAAPTVMAQTALLDGAAAGANGFGEVRSGLFLQGQESYRVVDTAGYRTLADAGDPQPGTVEQVGFHHGCFSCGNSGCDGGCAGGSACGSCGHGYGGFTNPCAPCDPFCYVSFEAVYMDNDTANSFTMSQDFSVGDFDYEWAPRITIGTVPDCVHGFEAVFVGPLEWDRRLAVENAAGTIRTRLIPGAGVDLVDVSAFADFTEFTPGLGVLNPEINFISTFQSQRYEAEYWNLELNKTTHAGEFAKLIVGSRYISYEERYTYVSQSPGFAANPGFFEGRNAGTGILQSGTSNDMYGLQVGMDLLFPICCYGYSDTRLRAGGFINAAENQFRFVNLVGDVQQFSLLASDSTTELAGLVEFATGVRYQVGSCLSLRAGVEFWYLTELATARNQFRSTIHQNTGRQTRTNGDVLMSGVSFGAEFKY